MAAKRPMGPGPAAWAAMIGLAAAATAAAFGSAGPGWVRMAAMVGALFAGFKLASGLPRRRRIAYALWPGIEPAPFDEPPKPSAEGELALAGTLRIAAGAALIAAPAPPAAKPWLAVASFLLCVHMGLFDLMAALWRAAGIPVGRISPAPWRSASLAEFWGRRWNRAFHLPARDALYRPVARRFGRGAGVAAVFLFSGLVHELVLSWPAGGGWGLPTLYFAIHGALVWMERRGIVRGRRWTTVLFVLLPLPLLAHPPFIERVLLPVVIP